MSTSRYFLQRILLFPISLFVVVSATFLLLAGLGGDSLAQALAGPDATGEQVATLRHRLGLDVPLQIRYQQHMLGILHGDFGRSFSDGSKVTTAIATRLPASLELVVPGLLLAALLGITIGSLGAYYSGRVDEASRWLVTTMQSIPEFLLGIVLLFVFFLELGIAPSPVGQIGLLDEAPPHVTGMYLVDALVTGHWAIFASVLGHMVLPVATITVAYSVVFSRISRAAMGAALRSEYVEFARACGLSEWQIIRYALLDVRTQLLTYGAILLGGIIGGGAIVELIYSWQGLGQWALAATLNLDLPAVVGYVTLTASITLTAYFLLDLLTFLLDPRVSFRARR